MAEPIHQSSLTHEQQSTPSNGVPSHRREAGSGPGLPRSSSDLNSTSDASTHAHKANRPKKRTDAAIGKRSVSFEDPGDLRSSLAMSKIDEETHLSRSTPALDERTGILNADIHRERSYASTAFASSSQTPDEIRGNLLKRTSASSVPKRQSTESGEVKESKKTKWFQDIVENYGALELENKGSVARDHLALERTFLAWLRTSLSFCSIGIAVTQLFRLNTSLSDGSSSNNVQNHLKHVGRPLGATFIGISLIILFIGFHRYFESQHYVVRGKFPASRGSVVFVSLIAGAIIIASMVVVLAIAKGSFD